MQVITVGTLSSQNSSEASSAVSPAPVSRLRVSRNVALGVPLPRWWV